MSIEPIHVGQQLPGGIQWEVCRSVTELNDCFARADHSLLLSTESRLNRLRPIAGAVPEIPHLDFDQCGPDAPSDAPILLLDSTGAELADIWTLFPKPVAIRIRAPEEVGDIRVSTQCLRVVDGREGPFRQVSHPVWDWLIRQVDADVQVRLVRAELAQGGDGDGFSELTPPCPGADRGWLRQHLVTGEWIGSTESPADAIALRAGLLQIHDFLEESHQLAQTVEGRGRHANGDYWHAIMHRREPDYDNAKYWFRRVGHHPVFSELARFAHRQLRIAADDGADTATWERQLGLPSHWDSLAFVDLCRKAADPEGQERLHAAVGTIQWKEMLLLLKSTWQDATEGRSK